MRIGDDDKHEEKSSPASSFGNGLKVSPPRLGSTFEDDAGIATGFFVLILFEFELYGARLAPVWTFKLHPPPPPSPTQCPTSNASFASSPPPALSMVKGSIPAFSPIDGGFNHDLSVASSPLLTARATKAVVPPFSPIAEGSAAMSFGGMDGSIVTFGGADGS